MGQGGQEDRLAEADAAAGVRGSASAMGGGAHLLLVGAEQEDEQRLREAVRKRGGVHLRRDDPFDGKAPSPWLRISKQFQRGYSRKPIFRCPYSPKFGHQVRTKFRAVAPYENRLKGTRCSSHVVCPRSG